MPNLVVSRRANETILIDVPGWPAIAVTVVEVRGNRVRIGIEAPPSCEVNRSELRARKFPDAGAELDPAHLAAMAERRRRKEVPQ